jgi:hypothetical protein
MVVCSIFFCNRLPEGINKNRKDRPTGIAKKRVQGEAPLVAKLTYRLTVGLWFYLKQPECGLQTDL